MSPTLTSHTAKNGFGLKHSTPQKTPFEARQTRAREGRPGKRVHLLCPPHGREGLEMKPAPNVKKIPQDPMAEVIIFAGADAWVHEKTGWNITRRVITYRP